ncbi:hypothetical protein NRIC_27050 [Enterococcus florum]|uniref:Uncharacterized protein n=1 Tax=Enterococcus florum TaxID=2480627 RepID=A0A4P5PE03_9ENTE|nr:hypothetical protein [Enterococcus florum]GCF94814.1 hypothetical protein NRIC_27050 [Enterococcus florum]
MSKKVIWIWSLNSHQQTVTSLAGMNVTMRPYKFQRELKEALAPEWTIDFISDDLSKELPTADVVVIPRTGKALYAERAKQAKVIWVSGNEVLENDYEGIKKKIAEA